MTQVEQFPQDCPEISGVCQLGVTLLELLRFFADTYMQLMKRLMDLESHLNIDEAEAAFATPPKRPHEITLTTERRAQAAEALAVSKVLCEKIRLQVCVKHVDELMASIKQYDNLEGREVEALRENVVREIGCHFFVGVAPERIDAFNKGLKGWETVTAKIPGATEDIEEMNKCFALCRYSAAVFHSLLVMEHGLVELGKLIGVTDPKEGWDASCRRLEAVVKAGRSANTTGLQFDFLDQLNTAIQSIKLAWRNKVNHATGKPMVMGGGFAPYAAEEIMTATRGFMRRLVEGLS